MSRVDKAEDSVEKLFSHYSEEWCRYAQSLEKDTLKSKACALTCVCVP